MRFIRRGISKFYNAYILPLTWFYYIYFIPLSIIIALAIQILFTRLKDLELIHGIEFVSDTTPAFLTSFFEGFGIIYAFSLPIIITKTWEQFDNIAREFNNEADAVKILYEDVRLIYPRFPDLGIKIINYLTKYVRHILHNYQDEGNYFNDIRIEGDYILSEIRGNCNLLINRSRESELLGIELIQRLDDLIRIRGNRITLSQQSVLSNLRLVGLITSILFVLPLYFVRIGFQYGLLLSFE